MKFLVYIFLVLIVKVSFAQIDYSDTVWMDSNWKKIAKDKATLYTIYKKTDKNFIGYYKYLNGNLQIEIEAISIKPLIHEGYANYYNIDGTKDKKGFYKDGNKYGVWTSYFDNGKDSSVYEYQTNSDVKYIRRSKLQKEEIYTMVEVMPEFQGGQTEMINFIQTNISYPRNSMDKKIGGKVFLKFVVSDIGNVSYVEVLKGTGIKELDDEAVRVIRLMPKWKPGFQNGKNVSVFFNLPIAFSLKELFFVFDTNNKNEDYIKATDLIYSGKFDEALTIYKRLDSDIDVWFNVGVICYYKKEMKESKKYFRKIMDNYSETLNPTRKFIFGRSQEMMKKLE